MTPNDRADTQDVDADGKKFDRGQSAIPITRPLGPLVSPLYTSTGLVSSPGQSP